MFHLKLREKHYCLTYFDVTLLGYHKKKDYIVYSFKIVNLHSQNAKVIEKRYKDFRNLNAELKKKFALTNLPTLPRRKLANLSLTEKEISDRKEALLTYLKILLNENIYLKPPVFKFIDFDEDGLSLQEQFLDVSDFVANALEPLVIMKPQQFTLYRFIIRCTDSNQEISKRYTDFEALQ